MQPGRMWEGETGQRLGLRTQQQRRMAFAIVEALVVLRLIRSYDKPSGEEVRSDG